MKNIKIIGTFFLMLMNTILYAQVDLEWGYSVGGVTYDDASGITSDHLGNVYVIGNFQGTVDFDPEIGILNITSQGSADNVFIQKLSPSGSLVWVKSIGGTGSCFSSGISVDALQNVYITGTFNDTVDFDPGAGVLNLSTMGSSQFFVEKLNSNGDLLWATATVGHTYSISTDAFGGVYTTGRFQGTVDFDPGVGVLNLISSGGQDFFVQKLDSNGHLSWAQKVGGVGVDYGNSIDNDDAGNVYITGFFDSNIDFDPGPGILNLGVPGGGHELFVQKLDSAGNLLWAKSFEHANNSYAVEGNAIVSDKHGNSYITGHFRGIVDFDPGPGVLNLGTASGAAGRDIFIQKLDSAGDLVWAKSLEGQGRDEGESISVDSFGNVYLIGRFEGTVDFDPNARLLNLTSFGNDDFFIEKLDSSGNLVWAKNIGGTGDDYGRSIDVNPVGEIHIAGSFNAVADFDPGFNAFDLTPTGIFGGADVFAIKLKQQKILGRIYNDFNQNCIEENNEIGIGERNLIINPGGIVITTTVDGYWGLDSLPNGTYNLTVDTSGSWISTCPSTSFTVTGTDYFTYVPSLGLFSTKACPSPDVSIHAPILRPGFSNQRIFIQVCNTKNGTKSLDNKYLIIELDSSLTPQTSSLSYTSLGNNQYRVDLDTIYPSQCTNFWINCTLNSTTPLGKSLCMSAQLYSVDSCVLDTIRRPFPSSINSCNTIYDNSHLTITSVCNQDTINFVIRNTGNDMTCFSQVRLFLDGQFIAMDSIQLMDGDSTIYTYVSDGRTWRMEVDQHPDHLGNSRPSTTLECCGGSANWTPDLVNTLPHDDADPIIDIYCGLVRGSYDPNDKMAYPLGLSTTHDILPNQDIEYLIRFQNTGTDTAFTVIIRDTLSENLDIFSVQSGVSSHNYTFRMYGPRVLEWTFNNILLPDSTTNEPASNGFIKFKVRQVLNLPIGTLIDNSAAIYFDFNPPIITNTYTNTINDLHLISLNAEDTITTSVCDSFLFNGFVYKASGTYWQPVLNNGIDSLYTIHLSILNTYNNITIDTCNTYTLNGQYYSSSGIYTQIVQNGAGCDSTITINLTIKNSSTSVIDTSTCNSYTAPDGQLYNLSGQYTSIILNTAGCDSIITVNLTIKDSSTNVIDTSICNSYIAPDGQLYNLSGQYTSVIPNTVGCDSIITVNLTIKNSSTSVIDTSTCNSYTAPDGQLYNLSGQYTSVILNTAGCDSIITVNLTIKDSSTNVIDTTICNSYIAPDGQLYNLSGQYTSVIPNTVGCDSIITVNLTIKDSSTNVIDTTICNSYIAPDGQLYNLSGQYTSVIPNTVGCDSIITVNLTIKDSSTNVIDTSICNSYIAPDGQLYNLSGQYTSVIPNGAGCDSIITVNLTIDSLVSDSIIQNGINLSAYSSGLSYQWIDCNNGNSPISGATNQQFTPINNGNYAVEITNGSCVLISDCIDITTVGNSLMKPNSTIKVYPNPTKEILYIKQNHNEAIKIEVMNNLGQKIYDRRSSQLISEINLDGLASGVYYLLIRDGASIISTKVVKE
jgi:uncharacterized repeat protein (TIGR01451 family)